MEVNMANITTRASSGRDVRPFDPFDDPLEDIFRGFFLQPMAMGSGAAGPQAQFRTDITEHENEYQVRADIPGVRKEDINVTIDGDQVAISAETKREKDVKDDGGRVLRSERHYGKLYRAFALGEEVDEARAQARYNDGVLELTLPKKAADTARKKRVTVK
jgi:HSP20 family protein